MRPCSILALALLLPLLASPALRASPSPCPLRREGMSRPRCFWYGQLSAVVEPIAAVIGAGGGDPRRAPPPLRPGLCRGGDDRVCGDDGPRCGVWLTAGLAVEDYFRDEQRWMLRNAFKIILTTDGAEKYIASCQVTRKTRNLPTWNDMLIPAAELRGTL
jgi:hypothetical protein